MTYLSHCIQKKIQTLHSLEKLRVIINHPLHRGLKRMALPLLQPYINPSTSQYRHFNPEDGKSTFPQEVGIYRRVYTTQKSRSTSTSTSTSTSASSSPS
jgi:hypothetical protein